MNAGPSPQVERVRWLVGLFAAVLVVWAAVTLWRGARARPSRVAPATTAAVARRPSIILISLDTLRPDHVGSYGYTKSTTPNLDRFAAGAARFTQARSQAPWTLLSHMSLFTSRLPSHNGVDTITSVLPDDVPTLAQLLAQGGYNTAAIVNNGQIQKRWGFNRGFQSWQELPEGPKGACNAVTDQALAWLGGQPPRPYFLFLHYFDAHAPYVRPAAFAQAMGSEFSSRLVEPFLVAHRFMDDGPVDPQQLRQLIGAYDGSINWLDWELGRLLEAIPPEVAVVIFSDHGEAFREHGYFVHGSTLFEEEVRTVLLVRLPGQAPRVIDAPVALLDVAPTLLGVAGLTPPAEFEGQDLQPLLRGEKLNPGGGGRGRAGGGGGAGGDDRLIPAEIRLPIQRSALQSVVGGEWKAVVSTLDGSRQLYHLPDELHDRAAEAPAAGAPLFHFLDKWASERDYWVLYARGPRHYEVAIQPREGSLTAVVPSDMSHEGSQGDVPPESPQSVIWKPLAGEKTKMLYIQLSHPGSALQISVTVDGVSAPEALTVGPAAAAGVHPATEPQTPGLGTDLAGQTLRPVADQPAKLEHDGVLALRYRGTRATGRNATVEGLDAETQERLRSLGYIR